MKDLIVLLEKDRDNKELLAIKNVNKIAIAEVAKVSNTINLDDKYNWTISNGNIDVTEDLRLTGIKKYWRCAGRI